MQEPNYNLTDGNGNVIAQLGTNTNGDFVVEHSSGDQAVFNDGGLQVPAINTDRASITEIAGAMQLSTKQTISSNTGTQIQYDVEQIGTGATVDTTNHKIIIDNAGTYTIRNAVCVRNVSSGTQVRSTIKINGSTYAERRQVAGSYEFPTFEVCKTAELSENDEIEGYVKHFEGTDRDLNSTNEDTYFQVVRHG